MHWYTEELRSPQQPDGAVLTLIGTYNPPGGNLPMITLRLHIEPKPGDTQIVKSLMEKNPSMLRAEDPSEDDIQAKYYRQVLKAREKIEKTPYTDILNW
jgi:hypothetical protein